MALVDRMEKQVAGFDNPIVMINHGDVPEDAELLRSQVESRLGIHNFIVNPVGPVIGSHGGPGILTLHFLGSPR